MVSIVSFSLWIAFFSSLDVYLSISTSIIFNNIIRRFVLILNCTWRALHILFILGFYSAKKLFLHCTLYYCIYFVYSVLFFSNSNYLLYVCFFLWKCRFGAFTREHTWADDRFQGKRSLIVLIPLYVHYKLLKLILHKFLPVAYSHYRFQCPFKFCSSVLVSLPSFLASLSKFSSSCFFTWCIFWKSCPLIV